jgi:hypothetical protein
VGFWPLDEGTGSSTLDMSGNNAGGTWVGTAGGTNATYYSPGKVEPYAGYFDGNTNYAPLGSTLTIGTVQTVTAWVKPNGQTNYPQLGAIIGNNTSNYAFHVDGTADTGFGITQSSSGAGCAVPSMTGVWHQIVAARNGLNVSFYEDGAYVCSGTLPANENAQIQYLARRSSNGPLEFHGLINNIRVYNRVLSATEIADLYSGGK